MDYKKDLKETLKITDLSLTITKEYYKKHPRLIIVHIVIIVITSFIGLVMTGIVGIVIGFVVGILAFCFLPPAVVKIREIYNR